MPISLSSEPILDDTLIKVSNCILSVMFLMSLVNNFETQPTLVTEAYFESFFYDSSSTETLASIQSTIPSLQSFKNNNIRNSISCLLPLTH